MSLLLGVSIGTTEVRVIRSGAVVGGHDVPDLVLERGSLTVREALLTVRLLTAPVAGLLPVDDH